MKLPMELEDVRDVVALNIKVKEIIWVRHEGYRIVERPLGDNFRRNHEFFMFKEHGENYELIKESRRLDEYKGLSYNYEYDRELLSLGLMTKTTASGYEALKYILENKTDEWSKSPYSPSYYSSKEIGWGYKPEGSLRVADHWNFGEAGHHCPTAEPVDGWAVCRFEDGVYHLVKQF